MEDFDKLRLILNEFDNRLIDRLSYAVEEDALYIDRASKTFRIVEFCLSNDSKKSRDLEKILFDLGEKHIKLLEDFNHKKDQMFTTSRNVLEDYIKSNWKKL